MFYLVNCWRRLALTQIGLFAVTLLANGVAISDAFLVLFLACVLLTCVRAFMYIRKRKRCAIINIGYMCSGSSRVGIVKRVIVNHNYWDCGE